MQNAEAILNVIQTRGMRRLPLNNAYRVLYNENLYLRAYHQLAPNQGALTPGITEETADGMTMAKIQSIIEALRYERYRWTPVKRVYIPKPNGKSRPLGIPTWSDKLLQEVIRMMLEAYYEPRFKHSSHGFRPQRGCHTALDTIRKSWKGTKWFIEGDIKGCFDNIDHKILLNILGRDIKDNRFLNLLKYFLAAGYMEDWKVIANFSGTPQGGVLSPILSNIYLNELDEHIENELIPQYSRGKRRRHNPEYTRLSRRRNILGKKGDYSEHKNLTAAMRTTPSYDPQDPNYRRLRYVRYADDFLLGFAGPKREAEDIRDSLAQVLRDHLKLELSEEKTLITHASSQPARFLGYDIQTQMANDRIGPNGQRSINGQIGLRVPQSVITEHCQEYMKRGKPAHRAYMMNDSDFAIVSQYGLELRGVVQYYKLAWNVAHLWRLYEIMRQSLHKTLALKHKTNVSAIRWKYETIKDTGEGYTLKCTEVVVPRDEGKDPLTATFGGHPIKRDVKAIPNDFELKRYTAVRSDLLTRMLADTCEVCGSTKGIEVHHIRALRDLNANGRKPKPKWMQRMIAIRRKTLAVCRSCHKEAHGGNWRPRE